MRLDNLSLVLAIVAVLTGIVSLYFDEQPAFFGFVIVGSTLMAVSIGLMIKAHRECDCISGIYRDIRAWWRRRHHYKQTIKDIVQR